MACKTTMFEVMLEVLGAGEVERREEGAEFEAEFEADGGSLTGKLKSVGAYLGDVRGMIQHLRTRPAPRQPGLAKMELEILAALRELLDQGRKIVVRGDEDWVERELFLDLFFAVTTNFFGLLERLDDDFPI